VQRTDASIDARMPYIWGTQELVDDHTCSCSPNHGVLRCTSTTAPNVTFDPTHAKGTWSTESTVLKELSVEQ
jgi:hypothetical protein